MQISNKNLKQLPIPNGMAQKITYSNGSEAYIFQNTSSLIPKNIKVKCGGFPPINRGEPMTQAAFKRTLNKKFDELIKLDLQDDHCLSLTLTIRSKQYNTYEQINDRFKHFTNEVRFCKKVGNSYLGVVRFIEIQEKGFYHIHCILVFDTSNIKLTWKDLHRFWGWGYVKVKEVYYFIGLIDYLTNPKTGAMNGGINKFTNYPKGKKIIYISPSLPKAKSEFVDLMPEEYLNLINHKNCFGHIKAHKYYDFSLQKTRVRIDKSVLIKTTPAKEESKY